ncbi:hypothetical protein [Gordonia shandongensis]|uniref:hypothetical protein n=1 Tax=Gordonia shandongensis TaxID=376351 RepID=UPI000404C047|nr:hypothetical protein [Gordonia shandongensis]
MKTTTSPREIREAVTHVAVTIGLGVVLAVASAFAQDATRTFLIIASMTMLVLGTVAAVVRTYRNWRAGGRWQIWQGACWFLLALSLVWFTDAVPLVISD